MELIVNQRGTINCIYSEAIPVSQLGSVHIQRASRVEPTADGKWTADLRLVNGPLLGPFLARSEALEAEVNWLRENWLESAGQS